VSLLVFWGAGSPSEARRRHAQGARLLAWGEPGEGALRAAGVPFLQDRPSADEQDRVDEAAIGWTKAFGTRPVLDGKNVRALLSWKGVSLWWFAELYLHHSTRSPARVRTIEAFIRILERERPQEVEAVGLSPDDRMLLARTCTARGILFHGAVQAPTTSLAVRLVSLESRWNSLKALASALKAVVVGPAAPPGGDGRRRVLFLSHAAFWRVRRDPVTGERRVDEHYFDRLLPEVAADPALRVLVLAVGPRAAFRRRGARERLSDWLRLRTDAGAYLHVNRFSRPRVFRETLRATHQVRAAWKALRASPGVREAFAHRGVSFADLAGADLAATLLLQLPWAVRSYEEMAEALATLRPAACCLYAESSGWGRAAVAACRAAGVPSLALQHGILYPKYYSYRHAADEADCPLPDRTALFGESARDFLVTQGRYPPASLVVTGSPKFDELLRAARQWDRPALRRRFGVREGEALVAVASRFRGIRETHQSLGSAFPGLVRAVEALPGTRCVVKPHPAEPPDGYERVVRELGATRVTVLQPGAELMELLHAADALVTVESLSAIEALVLGCPVLVLNMPTNLQELVAAGAALGVAEGEDPAAAVRAVLLDGETRRRLAGNRERYLSLVAAGVDGGATARIHALIRETAGVVGL
jgi:glycosyltransferase involved in cell wall biosynthesis